LMTAFTFFMAIILLLLQQRQLDRMAESRDRIQDAVINNRLSTTE